MANGKLAAAWNKWKGENVVYKAALKWKKMGKDLYLQVDSAMITSFGQYASPDGPRYSPPRRINGISQTGLGFFSELVRRWKLLRKVLLRCMNVKLAAGWSRWLEIDIASAPPIQIGR